MIIEELMASRQDMGKPKPTKKRQGRHSVNLPKLEQKKMREALGVAPIRIFLRYDEYTPLNASRSTILVEIQGLKFLKWPQPMKVHPSKKNTTKYCEFHRDHGHNTDECQQLRDEIEYPIRRGYLKWFNTKKCHPDERRQDRDDRQDPDP